MPASDDWVEAAVISNSIEAEARKAVLESYGIPVQFRSQVVVNPAIRNIHVGPLGEISILVPSNRAEEAIALLHEDQNPNAAGPSADQEKSRSFDKTAKILLALFAVPLLLNLWRLLKEIASGQ